MIDTRSKIISPDRLEALLSSDAWTVIAGSFDPLTAEQAARLASFTSGNLAVLIEANSHHNLLTPEARAILVAALRCVDAVSIVEHAPAFFGAHAVQRDEAGERLRTQAFIDLVVNRQTGASA